MTDRRGVAKVSAAALLLIGSSVAFAMLQSQEQAAVAFDGERALAHAAAMVAMGPRPLGSEALERNRSYIEEELEAIGLTPEKQTFIAATPIGPVEMANIVAKIDPLPGGGETPALLLAGHYDTKLFEGMRFVGANDGASSAAILLELGRVLVEHPARVPVWLVFFDGEEAVVSWSDTDSTYGSRHMVERMREDGSLDQIGALVLFDMIGDADLRIPHDTGSTPWLGELIWEAARETGHEAQFPERSHSILDDHLPFIDAGVAAIDLIDFNYGPGNRYWHSPFDTIDRLGANSFQAVGETVLKALPRIAERITRR